MVVVVCLSSNEALAMSDAEIAGDPHLKGMVAGTKARCRANSNDDDDDDKGAHVNHHHQQQQQQQQANSKSPQVLLPAIGDFVIICEEAEPSNEPPKL